MDWLYSSESDDDNVFYPYDFGSDSDFDFEMFDDGEMEYDSDDSTGPFTADYMAINDIYFPDSIGARSIILQITPNDPEFTQEFLWEHLYYLQKLLDICIKRVTLVERDIHRGEETSIIMVLTKTREFFFSLVDHEMLDAIKKWLLHIEDMFIYKLETLMRKHVPYVVWQLILKYLRKTDIKQIHRMDAFFLGGHKSAAVQLDLKIHTFLEDGEGLVVEKQHLLEATSSCRHVIMQLLTILYSRSGMLASSQLIKNLNTINFRLTRLFGFIKSVNKKVPSPPYDSPRDAHVRTKTAMIPCTDAFRNNENALVRTMNAGSYTIANSSLRYPSRTFAILLRSYHHPNYFELMCYETVVSLESLTFQAHKSFYSADKPTVYAMEHMVGVLHKDSTLKDHQCLMFFDFLKHQKTGIHIDLKTLQRPTSDMSIVEDVVMARQTDEEIKIAFTVLSLSGPIRMTKYVFVTSKCANIRNGKLTLEMECEDSSLLALYKEFLFLIKCVSDPEKTRLLVFNIKDKEVGQGYPILNMTWDTHDPWNVRFNSDEENLTFVVYRKNEFQVRRLDAELSFVRDIYVYFNPVLAPPLILICGDVLYCWQSVDDDRGDPLQCDEQFILPLSPESNPLYFNGEYNGCVPPSPSWDKLRVWAGYVPDGRIGVIILGEDLPFCNTIKMKAHYISLSTSPMGMLELYKPELDRFKLAKEQEKRAAAQREEKEAKTETNRKNFQYFQKHHRPGVEYDSILNTWKPANGGFGFANVMIKDRQISVYFHRSEFRNLIQNGRRVLLRPGLHVTFFLKWENPRYPRPRAHGVYLL